MVAIVGNSSESPQQIQPPPRKEHGELPAASSQAPAQSSPPALDMPHYGIGFIDAIKRGFKKYATFSGRASRGAYWWWALLPPTIVSVVLLVPAYVLGITTSPDGGRTPGTAAIPLIILMIIFYLAIIVPNLALTVRRLHDAGYSGWLVLLGLVPYLGGLILLIFAVLPLAHWSQVRPVPATPYGDNPYQPQNSYPRKAPTRSRTRTHHKRRSGSHQTAPGDQNQAALRRAVVQVGDARRGVADDRAGVLHPCCDV